MKMIIRQILLIGLCSWFIGCDPTGSVSLKIAISGFSPAQGPVLGNVPITVVGRNFQKGATIQMGQVLVKDTSITNQGTNLSFTLPASPNMMTGKIPVTIINPSGDMVTSNEFGYYYGTVRFDSTNGPVTASNGPLSGVATGDFDQDGYSDLVVVNTADTHVDLFYGQASGKLIPATNQPTSGAAHLAVAAADFNKDGVSDILWLTASNMQILQVDNKRNVTGGSTLMNVGITNPQSLTTLDVDADGLMDIVVGNKSSVNNLNGFLNKGNFIFSSPIAIKQYEIAMESAQLVLGGDIDGDGKGDLTVISKSTMTGDNSAYILNSQGGFNFNMPVKFPLGTFPAQASALLADMRQTNKLDLICTVAEDMSFSAIVYANNSSVIEPFSGFQPIPTFMGSAPTSMVVADLNQDGYPDLALATGQSVLIFLNHSIFSGNFDFEAIPSIDVGQVIQSLVVGDFNGDRKPDLAATSMAGKQVVVLINTSN